MILLIDNYDSFTYNIAQYALTATAELRVCRNDEISIKAIRDMKPKAIMISPGPCTPDKAGLTEEVIRVFGETTPIFGVCLGMQAIGEVYGGRVVRAQRVMHGKASAIVHHGTGVFAGIPSPFQAIRYHSLSVERASLPADLEVTAEAEDREVMGLRHRRLDVEGVQFHPESILSEHGEAMIHGWIGRVLGNGGNVESV